MKSEATGLDHGLGMWVGVRVARALVGQAAPGDLVDQLGEQADLAGRHRGRWLAAEHRIESHRSSGGNLVAGRGRPCVAEHDSQDD